MNTENRKSESEEKGPITVGERLMQARIQLGLTQVNVSERLCLMLSIIKDIESNKLSPHLATTFARGYIRSYAKLVQIPEEELLPQLIHQLPSCRKTPTVNMQTFSMGKKRKRRDGWLMVFTWLVLFAAFGFTGAWWWQNHKVQQQEIAEMAAQSTEKISQQAQNSTSLPQTENNTEPSHPIEQQNGQAAVSPEPGIIALPSMVETPKQEILPTAAASIEAAKTGGLELSFSGDCWLEVSDATGKILISTLQKKGAKLELQGKAPYKLKLGAPSAVQIVYAGTPVDLGGMARSSQVVRLTIPHSQ